MKKLGMLGGLLLLLLTLASGRATSAAAQPAASDLCLIDGGDAVIITSVASSGNGAYVAYGKGTPLVSGQVVLASTAALGGSVQVAAELPPDAVSLDQDASVLTFDKNVLGTDGPTVEGTVVYVAVGGNIFGGAPTEIAMQGAVVSPDGATITGISLPAAGPTSILVYDVSAGTSTSIASPGDVVALSRDGTIAVALSGEGTIASPFAVIMIETATGDETTIGTTSSNTPIAIAGDASKIAFIAEPRGGVVIYDVAGDTATVLNSTFGPQDRNGESYDYWVVFDLALNGNGTILTTSAAVQHPPITIVDPGIDGGSFASDIPVFVEQITIATDTPRATQAVGSTPQAFGAAQTGSRVFIATDQSFTLEDFDDRFDVYLWEAGVPCPARPTVELGTVPATILSGEIFDLPLTITNPNDEPLDTSDLNPVVYGPAIFEVVSPATALPPLLPANGAATVTIEVRAAETSVDDSFQFEIELQRAGTNTDPYAVERAQLDIAARQPVDVNFTLSQLMGCDEESGGINDTLCPGGGPDGGGQGNQGDYLFRVEFASEPAVEFSAGAREQYGDLNERIFVLIVEEVVPVRETLDIRVSVFDDDGDEDGVINDGDDPIDVSPIDGEMTATIMFNYLTGEWIVDGHDAPAGGTAPNQHWTRGDGDTADVTNGGHPALVTFDVSTLQPLSGVPHARNGDQDGDGLLDGWELFGLEVVDVTQSNPVTNPNPRLVTVIDPSWDGGNSVQVDRPDILLENDWATDGTKSAIPVFRPSSTTSDTYTEVVEAFAAADRNIRLWIDTGELTSNNYDAVSTGPITPSAGDYGVDLGGGNEFLLDSGPLAGVDRVCSVHSDNFNTVKDEHFDPNRRWAFHYLITADQSIFDLPTQDDQDDCNSGGQAEIGGNDLLVLRGDAAVMMHELGHSLGLRHGGDDNVNCKPNFVSIMNYSYDGGDGILLDSGDYLLDFSPARYPTGGFRPPLMDDLVETSLDESKALQSFNSVHWIRYGDANGVAQTGPASLEPDYSADMMDPPFETGAFDINFDPNIGACDDPTPSQVLSDHDDWATMQLGFRHDGFSADAAVLPVDPEVGLIDSPEELEAISEATLRTDLELATTIAPSGASIVIEAELSGLDRRVVAGPNITVELSDGVSVPVLPDGCVIVTTAQLACALAPIVGTTTPTAPTVLQLPVVVGAGASNPTVTMTATSARNGLDNDPDPTNNVAVIALGGPIECGTETATITATPGVVTNGTPGDDVIVGTLGADIINGRGGNDIICGFGGDDVIIAAAGLDTIYGGPGNDRIWGGDGDDTIYGDTGIDRIRGGAGDDTMYGGDDRDVILGEAGIDIIYGEAGRDSLYGGSEDDRIDGGADTDLVRGQDGDDVLFGGSSGNDRLVGGQGNDTLDVSAGTGSNRLYGEDGDDTFTGSAQLDRMWGGAGADVMHAGGYNDLLRGDDGDDRIYGEDGRDTIDGGAGDDELRAGAGNADRLVGGAGTDLCDGGPGNFDFANATCETILGVP